MRRRLPPLDTQPLVVWSAAERNGQADERVLAQQPEREITGAADKEVALQAGVVGREFQIDVQRRNLRLTSLDCVHHIIIHGVRKQTSFYILKFKLVDKW